MVDNAIAAPGEPSCPPTGSGRMAFRSDDEARKHSADRAAFMRFIRDALQGPSGHFQPPAAAV